MPDVDVTGAAAGPPLLRIAERFIGAPLLIHPQKAEVLFHVLRDRLPMATAVQKLAPEASRFVGTRRRTDGSSRMNPAANGVAIITIEGTLVNRGAWVGADSGVTSYEGIAAQVRDAMADREVHSILLDIDSPGGEAGGMFGLAELVREAGTQKRITAVVNDMACSAAYGIASAAAEVVISPTSLVGSIGVVMLHLDYSRWLEAEGIAPTLIHTGAHKVDGNPYEPLSDGVRADLQALSGKHYDRFVEAVAAGRGNRLTDAGARATEARVYIGADAVAAGLADRIASFDAVLEEMGKRAAQLAPGTGRRSAMSATEPTGVTPEAHAAAVSAARAEGAQAATARIAAILTHAEAEGRDAQARQIALETDMSAEAAGKLLASFPKAAGKVAEASAGLAEFGAGSPAPKESMNDMWAKSRARLGMKGA